MNEKKHEATFSVTYVFWIQRPQDKIAWPAVYLDAGLAARVKGRISPLIEVHSPVGYQKIIPERILMDEQLKAELMNVYLRMCKRQDEYHLDYGDAMLMQDMTKLVGRVLDGAYKAAD